MKRIAYTAARCAQRGMSLIEVLVAVAIGLIGILIMTQAYLSSDEFNRATLGAGGAQTNGNVALFTLEREVRMAGYGINNSSALGCGNVNWYYDPDYSTNLPGGTLPNFALAPVVIAQTPNLPDQITVTYATAGLRSVPSKLTSDMAPGVAEAAVEGLDTFNTGDLVLLVTQSSPPVCTLVQATVQASKLAFDPIAPNNPPAAAGVFPTYIKDDFIFNLGASPIIRNYSINGSSLRLTEGFLSAGGAPTTTLDLVDGIVDLRAQYGKDTTPVPDGIVDTWDNVTPATAADWQQVLALRVGVVTRVGNYEKPTGGVCWATAPGAGPAGTTPSAPPTWSQSGTRPFDWTDFTDTTNQARCYRYRVFETTIPIRNLIWRYI